MQVVIKPKRKRVNYKAAECIGRFGYGNGRAERDYCTSTCPAVDHCWLDTVLRAESNADPLISRRWREQVSELEADGKSSKAAKRLASRRMLRKGWPDPAMDVVARNTEAGVKDRYSGVSDGYRGIKGATWLYMGRVVGYFPLA